jgi:hypothetical protein
VTRRLTAVAGVVLLALALWSAHWPTTPVSGVGLATPSDAESTSITCPGLSSTALAASGHIHLVNTTDHALTASATFSGTNGVAVGSTLAVAAHGTLTLRPSAYVKADYVGSVFEVNGAGVVGYETLDRDDGQRLACAAVGSAHWYFTDLSTLTGTHTILHLVNPSATPAVLNISTVVNSVIQAPLNFQGIVVASQREVALDIGRDVVNTTHVGVVVHALRGVVVASTMSFTSDKAVVNSGVRGAFEHLLFPIAATQDSATTSLEIFNPSSSSADVSVRVGLAGFQVTPLAATVPAGGQVTLAVSPTSGVPAAGYATLRVSSTAAIVAQLVQGFGSSAHVSAPPDASTVSLFDAHAARSTAYITAANPSTQNATLTWTTFDGQHTWTTSLHANQSVALSADRVATVMAGGGVLVTASQPVVTAWTDSPGASRGIPDRPLGRGA